MGRRKCRVILTLMVAGSIALTGCKKEAEQIVSKPLETVKGAGVAASASPTPSPTVRRTATPSPAPTNDDEEFVKGITDEELEAMPVWQQVGIGGALWAGVVASAVVVGYWIYKRFCRKPVEVASDDIIPEPPKTTGVAPVADGK
jgi:hypothetical protein